MPKPFLTVPCLRVEEIDGEKHAVLSEAQACVVHSAIQSLYGKKGGRRVGFYPGGPRCPCGAMPLVRAQKRNHRCQPKAKAAAASTAAECRV